MKYLCVTTSGDLELWISFVNERSYYSNVSWEIIETMDASGFEFGHEIINGDDDAASPEFFGREIIEEWSE